MVGVYFLNIRSKLLYFHYQQLTNLIQLGLNLHQARVIYHILLHLMVFSCSYRLEAHQSLLPQHRGLPYSLLELKMILLLMKRIILLAGGAELSIVIATRRFANGNKFPFVSLALCNFLPEYHSLQIIYQLQEMEQLVNYVPKDVKQTVVQREEYGTIVEKDKKKKKKKNKEREKGKEIDEDKIKQLALNSELYQISQLTPEEKQRYAVVENHPLKIICCNLPFTITIEEVFQYFNTVIAASNPELAMPLPIKDVQFDKAKTFAILTLSSRRVKDFFRSHPEFTYKQTTLKIMKPKDFFHEKYVKKNQMKSIGTDNRMYLGGLPLTFDDQQVKKICSTFGRIKYFNLVRQSGVSKGYCFFEYQQHACGQKAMKALNGMQVMDKKLKCHSASLANKALTQAFTPNAPNITGLQTTSKPANHIFGSYLLSYENITNLQIQLTLMNEPQCKIPSRVVQLLNMCYPEDLFDEEYYEDLELDVADECKKYGPIEKVVIPRPDMGCGYSPPSVGKVFVKFMYITHAKKARQGISGRVYNKRTVVVSFYPEEKFNLKEYLVSV